MQAAGARAHAALDAVTTDSEVQDLRLLGAPAVGTLDPLLQAAGVPATDDDHVVDVGIFVRLAQD